MTAANVENMQPKLSLVTTSYTMHRFHDICKLIDSIENQTCSGSEVVIVIDQSETLSKNIKEYVQQKNYHRFILNVILNTGKAGVNDCRNIAITASHGILVGIIDDDTILFPNWVEAAITAFTERNDLAAITGPALPIWEDPHLMSWFPQELYFVWGCTVWNWDTKRDIRNVGGMNCCFKKDVLVKSGLYMPNIGPQGGEEKIRWFYPSGEEIELSLRVSKTFPSLKILYDPSLKLYHKAERNRFNVNFLVKRLFRFGYTRNYIRHLSLADGKQNVLRMEEDHVIGVLLKLPSQFFRDLFKSPLIAAKKSTTVIAGLLFTGMGYVAYELVPYHKKSRM
jgi:glycosyltransferase involved in cell wall biosynthesis